MKPFLPPLTSVRVVFCSALVRPHASGRPGAPPARKRCHARSLGPVSTGKTDSGQEAKPRGFKALSRHSTLLQAPPTARLPGPLTGLTLNPLEGPLGSPTCCVQQSRTLSTRECHTTPHGVPQQPHGPGTPGPYVRTPARCQGSVGWAFGRVSTGLHARLWTWCVIVTAVTPKCPLVA